MYNDHELKILGSNKGLRYLLTDEKPDFKSVLKKLKYEEEVVKLQTELIKLQNWVVEYDKRILVLVEGRDFAGKGGAIKTIIEHLNPRSIKELALPKPSAKEQGQWYFQRYTKHLPSKGEMVFFDRSWYNRAMVEPVNGFCTLGEYEIFMKEVNQFERMLTAEGIHIIKFYLSITQSELKKRIQIVKNNPLARWQLSPVDKSALEFWDEYTRFKNKMFKKTNTKAVPWTIIDANDRYKARLNVIRHILSVVPYKE